MSVNSYDITEISKRYSKALMLVSNDNAEIEEINKNFILLMKLIDKTPELKNLIHSPLLKIPRKIEVLNKVFRKLNLSKKFIGFINTLTSHGKLPIIKKIFQQFQEEISLKKNITKVNITTSTPIDESLEKKIKDKLEEQLQSKIKLNKIVNPEIIGGIILKVKSIMIDHSIKSKLLNFKI